MVSAGGSYSFRWVPFAMFTGFPQLGTSLARVLAPLLSHTTCKDMSWLLWLCAVLVAASMLWDTFCKESRVWYLTPLSWERDERLMAFQPRGRTVFSRVTPYVACLNYRENLVIPTLEFLESAEHIVWLFEQFGVPFSLIRLALNDACKQILEQYKGSICLASMFFCKRFRSASKQLGCDVRGGYSGASYGTCSVFLP